MVPQEQLNKSKPQVTGLLPETCTRKRSRSLSPTGKMNCNITASQSLASLLPHQSNTTPTYSSLTRQSVSVSENSETSFSLISPNTRTCSSSGLTQLAQVIPDRVRRKVNQPGNQIPSQKIPATDGTVVYADPRRPNANISTSARSVEETTRSENAVETRYEEFELCTKH